MGWNADVSDYQLLFRQAPGLLLLLGPEPDYPILDATNAYLTATHTQREQVLGLGIFNVFPDNPDDPTADGVAKLRASLERVRTGRVADVMAVQKYDVRRFDAEGGGFEERHWSPVNAPILGVDGSLKAILHRVEDVTQFVRVSRQGQALEMEILRRSDDLNEANRQLREANVQLTLLAGRELESERQQRLQVQQSLTRAEEQLRHAQKMDAIGRLAGGVAHDFNNILTVILGNCALIESGLGEGDPLRQEVAEIGEAGERAALLTRQLLSLSRRQGLESTVLDVGAVVKGMASMLRRLLGEPIQQTLVVAPGLHPVLTDKGQLEQVLLNLCVNARDAMPQGGALVIEAANARYAPVGEGSEGDYVLLAVTDSGEGMDRATQERIFEPFFTTKPAGLGTGLGLSTVYGIVRQSQGHIWFYSEPGHGSSFKVYLPRHQGVPALIPAVVSPMARGDERILLVEDEPGVRQVVAAILRGAGYTVLEAAGPQDALTLWDHGAAADLLLTDVILPGGNGPRLAERLHQRDPGLRILCMSGYTSEAAQSLGLFSGHYDLIQKPLQPSALLAKVRDVLDRPPA